MIVVALITLTGSSSTRWKGACANLARCAHQNHNVGLAMVVAAMVVTAATAAEEVQRAALVATEGLAGGWVEAVNTNSVQLPHQRPVMSPRSHPRQWSHTQS